MKKKISATEEQIDKNWAFTFLIKEFKQESDRAAVILVAALIDEKLTSLLKSKLVALPTANDDLFEGGNAPISTFSSKIDLSFRLGLISSKFSRDIHLIRKIRNSFAHDIYGCDFENGSVKSRVMELYKTCSVMPFYEQLIKEKNTNVEKGTRGVFLFIASTIILNLDNILDNIKPIEPIELLKEELLYTDGNELVENRRKKNEDKKKEIDGKDK